MVEKNIELACIGSCCIDIIMNVEDVFRFEMIDAHEPDITKKYTAIEYSSKLNVKQVKIAPGGSAANVAADLGTLGVKTSYIGLLGDDFFGYISKEDLENAGVDMDSCILTSKDHTGVSVILITPFGKDRSILSYKGANNLITPEDIKEDWLRRAKNLQWTSLTSDSGVQSIEKCIKLIKQNNDGGLVFACPSISILKHNHEGAKKLVEQSDVLVLNKEEIFELTGEKDVLIALRDALKMGPRIVACTNGKEGSYITDGKILLKSKIYKTNVSDTTGAGDAFASGLIYACINNKSLEEMIKYGTAVSAFECSELGVRDGIPDNWKEIEDFIASHDLEIIKTKFDF
ncbi:MAG: carbohydrate kinase family protein [Promethearchaeota archaeon]